MMEKETKQTLRAKLSAIDKRWKSYALAGCICILFFVVLTNLGKIFGVLGAFLRMFKSVFFGAVIAYIINPLAVFLEKRLFRKVKKDRVRWSLSAVVALVIVLLLFSLLLAILIPQIADNIVSLVNNLDSYVYNLRARIRQMDFPFRDTLVTYIDDLTGVNGLLSKIGDLLSRNLKQILQATGNIGSVAMNWVVGAFIAIYFLLSKNAILGVFR